MANGKFTRNRKNDQRVQPIQGDLDAPIDALGTPSGATPHKGTSAKASSPSAERSNTPRLETDDLMALMDMDPSELEALMNSAVASAMEPGTSVDGVVTRVENQMLLVDIGGKSEAWMERGEAPDAKVGDAISAYVIHAGESDVQISKQLSGAAAGVFLEEAYATGVPVEGRVMTANKGGFDVRIGSVRAFCPRSLISRAWVEEPSVFVGQTLNFKVIEIGEKTVVSRRALEEEVAEQFAEGFWAKVTVGAEYQGTVRNIQPFGIFVDLGGVDGLVPKREMSWDMGASPDSLVNIGEPVNVRVVQVDAELKKITLTMKNEDAAPWRQVGNDFVEGGEYKGQVVRSTAFGLFVRLAEGLDGLLHQSKVQGPPPEVGSQIAVRIEQIDEERRRISLVMAGSAPAADAAPAVPEVPVSGTITEVRRNGLAIRLEDGREAWLPENEVDLPSNTILQQRYRRGHSITARIKEDRGSGQITLTTLKQMDDDWRQVARKQAAKKEGFGTFGDIFANLNLEK